MEIKPLDESISVAPQLSEADVAEAAAQGFKAIICNRPDGEEPGQPSPKEIREAAQRLGLDFAYVPAVMEYAERYGAKLKFNRRWLPLTARAKLRPLSTSRAMPVQPPMPKPPPPRVSKPQLSPPMC